MGRRLRNGRPLLTAAQVGPGRWGHVGRALRGHIPRCGGRRGCPLRGSGAEAGGGGGIPCARAAAATRPTGAEVCTLPTTHHHARAHHASPGLLRLCLLLHHILLLLLLLCGVVHGVRRVGRAPVLCHWVGEHSIAIGHWNHGGWRYLVLGEEVGLLGWCHGVQWGSMHRQGNTGGVHGSCSGHERRGDRAAATATRATTLSAPTPPSRTTAGGRR